MSGPGGEADADEVGEVERRAGDVLAFARHPVGEVAHLLVAPVRADQVRVVDIGVVDVLAGLHLGLQLFDDVAFADQVVRDLDAGDGGEGRREDLRFKLVRGDGLGDDLDLHALVGRGRLGEPVSSAFCGRASSTDRSLISV